MRSALAHPGKGHRRLVSAWVGTARKQWRSAAGQRRPRVPERAALMDNAEADVLAVMTFPKERRAKIHSTNPLERVNGEIKRRTDVAGLFPNQAAVPGWPEPACPNKMTSGRSSAAPWALRRPRR